MNPIFRAILAVSSRLSLCATFVVASVLINSAGCGDDEKAPLDPNIIITIPDAGCDGADCEADGGQQLLACGDGVVDVKSETCDDGNTVSGDGCSSACQSELCGNGTLDQGETCDPPVTGMCSDRCLSLQSDCGNGKVDPGEQCDDGNQAHGDGCRDCHTECGDGLLDRDIGEECEPQYTLQVNGVSTTCTPNCRLKPFCGDGKVDPQSGEECDPVNGSSCVGNCQRSQSPDAGAGCVPQNDAGTDAMPSLENIVPNPSFTDGLAGWSPGAAVVAVHVADQGAATPGSAKVTFTSGTGPPLSVDGISRCVVLAAGDFYQFEAKYFNPPAQPVGVSAFPVMLLYPNTTCSDTPRNTGPPAALASTEAGKWLSYKRTVDATTVAAPGTMVSLLLKLGVVVPAGKVGTVLWDDVQLRSTAVVNIDSNCGNCKLDPGETCDDGNRVRGDGCSPLCQRERDCGNGKVEVSEQCDSGKINFTDNNTCTPLCTTKTPCDDCSIAQCRAQVDVCLGAKGIAAAGPGQGEDRMLLCGRLRACVQSSGCNGSTAISTRPTLNGMPGAFIENCYCGTAGADCLKAGAANGSCRDEVEAALESKIPAQILQRMGGTDASYPLFAAVNELLLCEGTQCKDACTTTIKCGDNIVQERPADFPTTYKLIVAGKMQMCLDSLTPSGRGCSFEECDGSTACDENCFNLKCGNGLKQKGEQCDDGNVVAGDGCDASCKAEFMCGDNKLDDKFGEQCDPPNAGPLCSMAEFTANPTHCGCGTTCEYKVCGNGVVQEGEDCDPPNGTTCGTDCKRAGLSECMNCLLLVTNEACGKALMEGIPDMPGFEQGCLKDKPCFDLLQCTLDSKCGLKLNPSECFCGTDQADIDSCESPTFDPKGPCKAQTVAAYTSQFGVPPDENANVVSSSFSLDPAQGHLVSLGIAQTLADCSLYHQGGLEMNLLASGASEAVVNRCMAACGWR